MTRILLIFILAVELSAQTNVYLRASAPASQIIVGASNSTPIVVQTASPHGFSPSCNLTTNICYCGGSDLATGTGLSPANRVMECTVNDTTHLNLYDLSGTPIAGNGNWWKSGSLYQNGSSAAQYIGLLTKFTIPANPGPMGFLDGTNGDLVRRVAGNAYNGTSALTVAGCPSACVVTWTVSYSFASSKFPMQSGNHFSISGTGTLLDTCGDGTAIAGENSPYTAASVVGGVVTSNAFACSVSNGNYLTINPHCGPALVPNDTIGGTNYCSTVSQMAWTGNILWDQVKVDMSSNHLDCSPAPSCRSSFTNYKTVFDGGLIYPGAKIHALYAMAALRFLVDPSQALWLNEILYSLNNDFRASGTGYTYNTAVNIGIYNGDYFYTTDEEGFAIEYGVAYPYWAVSEEAAFRDRTYNDLDDPVAGPAVSTNMDAANRSTHNWVLSSGNLAAGTNDATHLTLPASDPHYGANGYYVGTVVELQNGGENYYNGYSYGLITAYSGGVATVAGGFSHTSPALNNLTDATYIGGYTGCVGTAGQVITIAFGAGGGYGILAFTGTNTPGTNVTIASPGTYGVAPTTGTVVPYGNATCSGTGNFTTHIGTAYIIYDTFTLSSTANGATTTATFTKTTNLNSGTTPAACR